MFEILTILEIEMVILTLIGFFLLFSCSSGYCEILYEFRADSGHIDTAWEYTGITYQETPIFNNSSVIVFDLSLGGAKLHKEFPVSDTSFFRLNFAFDSIKVLDTLPAGRKNSRLFLPIASLIYQDTREGPYDRSLYMWHMVRKEDKWFLVSEIGTSTPKGRPSSGMTYELLPNTPYCLEAMLICKNDSIAQRGEFRINGKTSWKIDLRNEKLKVFHQVFRLCYIESGYRLKGYFYFDNIAHGNSWLGNPPSQPQMIPKHVSRSTASAAQVLLFSPPFRSFLVPSSHAATQYQLRRSTGTWSLPIYASGQDSLNRDSLIIEMVLDYKEQYEWRIRHLDELGNVSDWSDPVTLKQDISLEITDRPKIHSAFFSIPEKNRPLDTLEIDQWYDFVAKLFHPRGWNALGYTLFWCNDSTYTLGNIETKGGIFLPAANYIYNFSFGPDKIFEKHLTGTHTNRNITGNKGLYIDASAGLFRMNPNDSTVRCRTRFLPQADPGPWCIRGFARDSLEHLSPLFQTDFYLRKTVPTQVSTFYGKSGLFIIISILFFCALLVFWLVQRKRLAKAHDIKPSRQDEVFRKVRDYINQNIQKEISMEEIAKFAGMSHSSIYNSVRSVTGKSLKNYVVFLKMEKAKYLLRTTSMNMNEISFAVGYMEPSNFTRMFKKITGQPPTEYRKHPV
jgi:AraC-like DNA-binding protein